MLESKEHYPYVSRSLIRLFNEGRLDNVKSVLVEPEYGYLASINYKDGSTRITYGNDLGLNTGTSGELAKDKGHTKFILRNLGVAVPEGREFLMPWWADTIRDKQRAHGHELSNIADEAFEYIADSLHYPVYVKPVAGSKGGDVYRVENNAELQEIFDIYDEKKIRLAVVEQAIPLPDYRIVMLDGDLISAYQRIPLAVQGNGIDSVERLLEKLQKNYEAQGRDTRLTPEDPRIIRYLGQKSLSMQHIPANGTRLTLASVSNLSAGGTSLDVSDTIAPQWLELSKKIAKGMNLRLCGVDLACADIASNDAAYAVLEVNAAPGLDHYASSGDEQRKIVDDLYVRVLNVSVPQAK